MLGCSLAEIGPEEVLQSTTSQLLGGVLPLNVSWRYASALAKAEPLDLYTVKLMMVKLMMVCDRCLLVKIPVKSAVSGKDGNAATCARNDAEKLDEANSLNE
jgi:hypothetical protein